MNGITFQKHSINYSTGYRQVLNHRVDLFPMHLMNYPPRWLPFRINWKFHFKRIEAMKNIKKLCNQSTRTCARWENSPRPCLSSQKLPGTKTVLRLNRYELMKLFYEYHLK